MANTLSKKTLDRMAEHLQKDFEDEQKLLSSMSESERIWYLAAKASFRLQG